MTRNTPCTATESTQTDEHTSGHPMNGQAATGPENSSQPLARPKRIQRKRSRGWAMPGNTRYVGRGTRYGNPWRIEREDDHPGYNVVNLHKYAHAGTFDNIEAARKVATARFRDDLSARPDLREVIRAELAGVNLACWCPLPAEGEQDHCHARILLEIANEVAHA